MLRQLVAEGLCVVQLCGLEVCTGGAWVAAVWCVVCCCELRGLLM